MLQTSELIEGPPSPWDFSANYGKREKVLRTLLLGLRQRAAEPEEKSQAGAQAEEEAGLDLVAGGEALARGRRGRGVSSGDLVIGIALGLRVSHKGGDKLRVG